MALAVSSTSRCCDAGRLSVQVHSSVCASVSALRGKLVIPAADFYSSVHAVRLRLQVFHAGTKAGADGQLVAAGGRVLGITALGDDIAEAQQRAYQVPLLQL